MHMYLSHAHIAVLLLWPLLALFVPVAFLLFVLEDFEHRKIPEEGKARTGHAQPSCEQVSACCLLVAGQGLTGIGSIITFWVEVFPYLFLSFKCAQVWHGWIV